MHENLKNTVILSEDIKAYQNNKPTKSEIADWQQICSGNDYGTLYSIYGKFIGKKKEDIFEVNKVQLYIQNYSGQISIGFNKNIKSIEYAGKVNEDINDPENDERYPNRNRFEITVGLQALAASNNVIEELDFDTPIKISMNDILYINTLFFPADSEFTNIFSERDIDDANFIDEKFLKRAGDDVYISDEGEKQLQLLSSLGVLKEDLKKLQLNNIDNSNFSKGMKKFKIRKNIEEMLGRRYPCTPKNAHFLIS